MSGLEEQAAVVASDGSGSDDRDSHAWLLDEADAVRGS
jgi:hypothetical protein